MTSHPVCLFLSYVAHEEKIGFDFSSCHTRDIHASVVF